MNNLTLFHQIMAQAFAEIEQLVQQRSFFECSSIFYPIPKKMNRYSQVFDIEFKMLNHKPSDVTYSVLFRKESHSSLFVNTVTFGSITRNYSDFEYDEKTLFKADYADFMLPYPKTLGTVCDYAKHLVVMDFLKAYHKLTCYEEKKPKIVTTLGIAIQHFIEQDRKQFSNIN